MFFIYESFMNVKNIFLILMLFFGVVGLNLSAASNSIINLESGVFNYRSHKVNAFRVKYHICFDASFLGLSTKEKVLEPNKSFFSIQEVDDKLVLVHKYGTSELVFNPDFIFFDGMMCYKDYFVESKKIQFSGFGIVFSCGKMESMIRDPECDSHVKAYLKAALTEYYGQLETRLYSICCCISTGSYSVGTLRHCDESRCFLKAVA
jgi:hypothetical protein